MARRTRRTTHDMTHRTRRLNTLTPIAKQVGETILQALSGKTEQDEKIVFIAKNTERGLIVKHQVIVNRQYKTRFSEAEWRKVFAPKWQPKMLLILEKLKETDNGPLKISWLVEQKIYGANLSQKYNKQFLRHGPPFLMRRVRDGDNNRCLQLAMEV